MDQIVMNAKKLGKALEKNGITVLGSHKDFAETHQVILDVEDFGGGFKVANLLSKANIITNKKLIPKDKPEDWDKPSGLRIGTTEITRLRMKEEQMEYIADLIADVLKNPERAEKNQKF